MSNLSKKELLALLTKKEAEEAEIASSTPICLYKASRGDKLKCTQPSTLEWGFCSKHANTTQGKNAKMMYEKEKELKAEEEKQRKIQEEKEKLLEEANEAERKALAKMRTKEVAGKKDAKEEKADVPSPAKPKIVKKKTLPKKRNTVTVEPNEFGNFEHKETGIVFDLDSRKAYGVQGKDGRVAPLSKHHTEICKEHGWPYQIPSYYEESDEESVEESDGNISEEEKVEEEDVEEEIEDEEIEEEEEDEEIEDVEFCSDIDDEY